MTPRWAGTDMAERRSSVIAALVLVVIVVVRLRRRAGGRCRLGRRRQGRRGLGEGGFDLGTLVLGSRGAAAQPFGGGGVRSDLAPAGLEGRGEIGRGALEGLELR